MILFWQPLACLIRHRLSSGVYHNGQEGGRVATRACHCLCPLLLVLLLLQLSSHAFLQLGSAAANVASEAIILAAFHDTRYQASLCKIYLTSAFAISLNLITTCLTLALLIYPETIKRHAQRTILSLGFHILIYISRPLSSFNALSSHTPSPHIAEIRKLKRGNHIVLLHPSA